MEQTLAKAEFEGAIKRATRLRKLCLQHASDLIAAADCVLVDRGYPNIAFHLAVLAL